MDLYRLSGKEKDLQALDLDHVFANCISLIEWPSRLGDETPSDRLDIRITIPKPTSDGNEGGDDSPRSMLLRPHGTAWIQRIQNLLDEGCIDDMLDD